jgi:radical SAM-linked protein
MKRYRITYQKENSIRYTSNLDIHKIWERWLRRAKLPISYSQGFHPQPKINQAAPLPLGMISAYELVDIWLDEDLPCEEVLKKLITAQQPGMPIIRIEEAELQAKAMQAILLSSTYQIQLLEDTSSENIHQKVTDFLVADEVIRERRGKQYNLRPLILNLQISTDENGKEVLLAELCMEPGKTGRADELVEALKISQEDVLIKRIDLKFPA